MKAQNKDLKDVIRDAIIESGALVDDSNDIKKTIQDTLKEALIPFPVITRDQAGILLGISAYGVDRLRSVGKKSKRTGKVIRLKSLGNGKYKTQDVLEYKKEVYNEAVVS